MNASGGFRAISGTLAGAGSGSGQSLTGGFASSLWGRIVGLFEQEVRDRRLFLWLPVFFGLGILAYFAADQEPPLWPAAMLALLLAAGGLRAHGLGRAGPARACAAGAFLFAGFACAALRTAMVEAPVLERQMTAKVTAFVEAIDPRIGGVMIMGDRAGGFSKPDLGWMDGDRKRAAAVGGFGEVDLAVVVAVAKRIERLGVCRGLHALRCACY